MESIPCFFSNPKTMGVEPGLVGIKLIALSVRAVIVRLGLTPRFTVITEASHTLRFS